MPTRTFDKPLDFMVAQNTSDIATLTARVDALDPELQTALFSDVAFSIVAAAWTEDTTNNVWTYTWNNALILADSGIFVIYDGSYRTALVGDINAHKNTGSVVFTTTKEPVGTLSGVIRIISSIAGVQAVSGGGTGAATPKGARENLNTPIRDIPVNLTAISSLPYTYYDSDIRANMKGFDFSFSNPSALPSGIDLTFADPSGNLGGSVTITGTISGETDIHFWCHEERTAPEGTETVQNTQRVQDFVQTNEQTLTAVQKEQVRENIDAASSQNLADNLGGTDEVFRFATDGNGKFGYVKEEGGADTFVPFKSDIVGCTFLNFALGEPSAAASTFTGLSGKENCYLFLACRSSSSGYVNTRNNVTSYSGCTLTLIEKTTQKQVGSYYLATALYKISNPTSSVKITTGSDSYGTAEKYILQMPLG